MSAPIAPEVRFAKHRLLHEIGPRGQERLCAARFSIDASDPAAAFAALLLERTGLERAQGAHALVPTARRGPVDPALAAADDALRGAIAAVQRVREIVGLDDAARALEDVRGAP